MFPQFTGAAEIYNLGLVRNYTTWLEEKRSCWNHLDKTIKLTGSIECVKVILKILLSFLLQHFDKKIKLWKMPWKRLKAFQLTRTFICHFLNLTYCVKQTPNMFGISQLWVHLLAHGAFSSPKVDKRETTTGGVL